MVPNLALAHAAQTLLEACAAAGALEWSIALGLALENSLLLAGARMCRQPVARTWPHMCLMPCCGDKSSPACMCTELPWAC